MEKKKIIMIHDGGVDDFASLTLILAKSEISILAVVILGANCFIENAVVSTKKLLSLTNHLNIPIHIDYSEGEHPFPDEWRKLAGILNFLPALVGADEEKLNTELISLQELASIIISSDEKITILMTSPCTPLVNLLKKFPNAVINIDKVIWMGGVLGEKNYGNVYIEKKGVINVEWNIYWDTYSATELFHFGLKIHLIPLNVTNLVPLTKDFLVQLAKDNESLFSAIVSQILACLFASDPLNLDKVYFWDVVAACYLLNDEIFERRESNFKVVTENDIRGKLIETKNNDLLDNKTIYNVNKTRFYKFVLDSLRG